MWFGRAWLAAFVALAMVHPAHAWDKAAHRMIAGHALQVLPERLAHLLRQHEAALLWGVVEPDFTREDDHRLPLAYLRGASKPGGADSALEKFARKSEARLKAGTKMEEIVFVLGQAAHFAQDLNVPLHTIRGDTREEHMAYEGAAFFLEWQRETHVYGGFASIHDYKCFAQEIARRSHQYYKQAFEDPPPSSIIHVTWRDAVNDTADLWQAIFYRALGPQKSFELYGIPAPKAQKGTSRFCR
jgi:hypothetical protein